MAIDPQLLQGRANCTVQVNPMPTPLDDAVDFLLCGTAADVLPDLLQRACAKP